MERIISLLKNKVILAAAVFILTVLFICHFSSQSEAGSVPVWNGGVDISWYTECADPEKETDFYIDTPEKLAGLAYIVNGRLDTGVFPTIMKENPSGKGAFDKTVEMDKYDPAKNNNVTDEFYVFNKYEKGKYDYDAGAKKYVVNTDGTGKMDKGSGVARFTKPVKSGSGDYDYDAASKQYIPNPGKGEYLLEVLTEYKFDRLDSNGKHNGNYDIDVEKTVRNVIDGAESDGSTASGLKAENFFVAEPTHIISSGGFGSADDYYYIGYQKHDFMGKTIHITSDMDLGGKYYSYGDESVKWYGPNWVPIGGYFIADTIATPDMQAASDLIAVESSFNGTIDGGYHTINNIYIDRWAGGNFMLCNGIGLIGSIGDLYDDKDSEYGHSSKAEEVPEGWVSSVRDLAVGSGYVYSNRMVGGLIGLTGNSDNGVLVENCSNSATVKSTDAKGTGGIIGATLYKATVRNCYNTGNITASYDSCPVGGIVGSNRADIYNCYNRGQITAAKDEFSEGIGSHYEGKYTVDNCYSRQGSYQDTGNKKTPGYYTGGGLNLIVNTYAKSASEMKNSSFVTELNGNGGNAFVTDGTKNEGYPVLFWQAAGFDPSKSVSFSINDDAPELGSVKAEIPRVKNGEGYTEPRIISSEDSKVTVPAGTVVSLIPNANAPNVLKTYTSKKNGGTQNIRGNYYTLTIADNGVTLGGEFKTLKRGYLNLIENSRCHTGISKSGVALDKNGKAWSVTDHTVANGETVFENDVINVKAILKKGVEPKNRSLEYTSKMSYKYAYSDGTSATNRDGMHMITGSVGGALEPGSLDISIVPETQYKKWSTVADTSWCDVSDLKKTYTIRTAKQLAGLAVLVNEGESFKGTTIKLDKDISLKNNDGTKAVRYWTAIGNGGAFSGTFDGAGHFITGMEAGRGTMSALFGDCDGAVIKRLKIKGKSGKAGIVVNAKATAISNCTSFVNVSGNNSVIGGIAAKLSGGGSITDCRNKGKVSGIVKAGGIAGVAESSAKKIYKCANYKNVNTTGADISASTGGIAGELGCEIRGCANFGKVTSANGRVGGVAGWTSANKKQNGNASAIYDSFNRGAVIAKSTSASTNSGGLVGYAQYLIMKNCYNTGSVSLGYKGNRPHKGQLIGYMYKSAFNSVKKVYFNRSGNSVVIKDTKDASNDGRDISKQKPALGYVKTTKMSAASMKKKAFTKKLNNAGKIAFSTVKASYPQLTWIKKLKDCKVTYKGAYTGKDETCYDGTVELPVCKTAGYMYTFTAAGKRSPWSGKNIRSNVTVNVKRVAVTTANIYFRAEGKTVHTISFKSSDKYIKKVIPDAGTFAPSRKGYEVSWDEEDLYDSNNVSYWDKGRTSALGKSDIIVNAVYSQRQLDFTKDDDGAGHISFTAEINKSNVNEDHYYFIKPRAKGTIVIEEGTVVTLDGRNGPFDNIRIIVEKNADVTLKDLELNTDPAYMKGTDGSYGILEVTGGSDRNDAAVIRASGHNRIIDTNDGGNGKGNDNFYPPMIVKGYVIFDQATSASDSLFLNALQKTPEINILNGSTLEIAGGVLEIYKFEKLGYKGGIIYGQGFDYATKSGTGRNQLDKTQRGDLTVSGGNLISISETNNVFALCVNKYKQTGGCAMFYATEAGDPKTGQGDNGTDRAIYASQMEITGGSLYAGVRTHQSDSKDPVYYYNNAEAIRCGNTDDDFSNEYFLYCVDTKGWTGSHMITVDGKRFYEGTGNLTAYKIGNGRNIKIKRSEADNILYLWLRRDSAPHTIAVDGKTIAKDVTPDHE